MEWIVQVLYLIRHRRCWRVHCRHQLINLEDTVWSSWYYLSRTNINPISSALTVPRNTARHLGNILHRDKKWWTWTQGAKPRKDGQNRSTECRQGCYLDRVAGKRQARRRRTDTLGGKRNATCMGCAFGYNIRREHVVSDTGIWERLNLSPNQCYERRVCLLAIQASLNSLDKKYPPQLSMGYIRRNNRRRIVNIAYGNVT